MDELILQLLSGSATTSQEERVRNWRAASPGNEAYFRSIEQVWRATEPAVLGTLPDPVDPAVILAAAQERRGLAEPDVIPLHARGMETAPRPWILRWSAAAAVAAAVAAVGLGIRVGVPGRPLA
ncbi:MAG TPA: hypothetical protein VLA36_11255, partial [Longimicrobiales bacterium]|nr:hypothetical protein [Longimicrobiales bacterium]